MPMTQLQALDIATIAKKVRAEIKAACLGAKVSVKSSRFAGGCSLNIMIKETNQPVFSIERTEIKVRNPGTWIHLPEHRDFPRYTVEGERLLEAIKDIVAPYHYDRSDPQTDYFNCNFYSHVEFSNEVQRAEIRAMQQTLGLEPEMVDL